MRILFVNCVDFLESTLPEGIALLSSILKRRGHETDIFDTAFMRPKEKGRKKDERLSGRLMFYKATPYTLRDLTLNEPETDIIEEFREKIKKFKPSLIAVSAMTTNYQNSMELIRKASPGCNVVVGGVHPTLMPDDVINDEEVDFICVGEGDEAFPELCEKLETGGDPSRIKNIYAKKKKCNSSIISRNGLRPFTDLDTLPVPDIGLFDRRHLFRPFLGDIYKGMFMSTSRGCPRGCAYCVNGELRNVLRECGDRYIRFQSPGTIAGNIKALNDEYGIDWFKFSDDTFLTRPLKDMYELRDLLKPLGIMFGSSVDPATVTEEKVGLAKDMGCVSMTIGIETGSEKMRRDVLGRNISNGQIKKALRVIRDHDIKISAFNMIGLPGETTEDVYTTMRFNKELEIRDANVYILYPYPGTRIYKDAGVLFNEYNPIPAMDEAYLFNLSKMAKSQLIFFLKMFNLFLVLPESYWGKIEEAKKEPRLHGELVAIAQDIVDKRADYANV